MGEVLTLMIYLRNVRVQWARKSRIGGKYPFKVEKPEDWETKSTVIIKEIPLVSVNKRLFNKIAKTLNDLPVSILASLENYKIAIKNGENCLAIDTQGYIYPRYKSYIVPQENY